MGEMAELDVDNAYSYDDEIEDDMCSHGCLWDEPCEDCEMGDDDE